jgi:hypothetical protein
MFQVVLQFARQYIGITYCQSLGPSQAQGSYLTRREPARRDHSRVLQLRQQKRLHARFYSSEK